jgi:proteic killer suppression protein
MRRPPGNRLEALKGRRRGQHRMPINDQWPFCFRWEGAGVCVLRAFRSER